MSLFPSVWRESGCESHFVIWRDKIFLFGQYHEDEDIMEASSAQTEGSASFSDSVRGQLSDQLVPFARIAENLDAVPWDVLTVCRQLVRAGFAREGKGKQRGNFGRV